MDNMHKAVAEFRLKLLIDKNKRIRELEEELADYKEGTEGLKLCVGDLRDERDRLRKALEEIIDETGFSDSNERINEIATEA